jgi:hypothetical protein
MVCGVAVIGGARAWADGGGETGGVGVGVGVGIGIGIGIGMGMGIGMGRLRAGAAIGLEPRACPFGGTGATVVVWAWVLGRN